MSGLSLKKDLCLLFFFLSMVLILFSGINPVFSANLSLTGKPAEDQNKKTFILEITNAPNQITSFGLDIVFDPNVLIYESIARGDLTAGFDLFKANFTENKNRETTDLAKIKIITRELNVSSDVDFTGTNIELYNLIEGENETISLLNFHTDINNIVNVAPENYPDNSNNQFVLWDIEKTDTDITSNITAFNNFAGKNPFDYKNYDSGTTTLDLRTETESYHYIQHHSVKDGLQHRFQQKYAIQFKKYQK